MGNKNDINPDDVHIIVDGSGPNGTFKEGDDIKKEVRLTLADFLHSLSYEGNNAQKIKSGLQKGSIKDGKDLQARGSENPYAPATEHPELTEYSDSKQFFGPDVDLLVGKGGSGHTLLKDIDKNSKIVKRVSEALSHNRFSPGPNSPFVNEGVRSNVIAGSQENLGVYSSVGEAVTLEDLQKIGFSLMLRAAGEIKAASEGDPNSGAAGAASLVPGKAQLAIVKIDAGDLEAKNAFGAPQKPETDIPTTGGGKSWGHLNTQLEPFDGFLPIGMTILSVALVIALKLVTEGLLLLLGLIIKPKADINFAPSKGPFILGEYGRPDPPNTLISLRDLGILPTDRDFITAANKGIDVFFKFDGSSFVRVVQNPGFYTIFVRNIIRSGNVIINSIKDVFTSNQNPLAAAQAFIGIIDVIKSSKIIAFLNIIATLGDRALELEETGFGADQKRISTIEFLPENAATRVMKSREGRSSLALAWRNSSVPSKFLFPKSALIAGDLISAAGDSSRVDVAMAGVGNDLASYSETNDAGNRLLPSVVADLESKLDAEYVPFYFHDLRTNEIISFHAFLDSLEINYAPKWEETSAYGRVDDVYSYSNTKRTINFTFNIVSTNKSDFDVMWWKINKLENMVYPQWSEGRQVHDPIGRNASGGTGLSFIQPFSQIPTASPIIRIRIGDLIRTNFSKFGLARLFGLGTDKAKDLVVEEPPEFDPTLLKKERERMLRNPAVYDPLKDGYMVGETAILLPRGNPGYIEYKNSPPPLSVIAKRGGSGKRLVSTIPMKVKIKRSPSAFPILRQSYGEHAISYYVIEVDSEFSQGANDLVGEFLVTHTDLIPDNQQIVNNVRSGGADATLTMPQIDFFDPNSNAVVKSFESTQGKGLAGVIKNFVLTDLVGPSTVWETDFNARAPKYIKVNISFDVIHDLPPGLDANGFPRAVNYPVGDIAAKVNGSPVIREKDLGSDNYNANHIEALSTIIKGDKKV